jgi:hypothetical protein
LVDNEESNLKKLSGLDTPMNNEEVRDYVGEIISEFRNKRQLHE